MKLQTILSMLSASAAVIPTSRAASEMFRLTSRDNTQNICYVYWTLEEDYAPREVPFPWAKITINIRDDLKVMNPKSDWPVWSNGDQYDAPQSISAGGSRAVTMKKITKSNNSLKMAWMNAEDNDGKDYLQLDYAGSDGKVWRKWKSTDFERKFNRGKNPSMRWGIDDMDVDMGPTCVQGDWKLDDYELGFRVRKGSCKFLCEGGVAVGFGLSDISFVIRCQFS